MASEQAVTTWDVRRLIKDLGGPKRVLALLFAAGLEAPTYRTIQSWVFRDSAPSDGVATLLALGHQLTPGFKPSDYIVVADENGERPL